MANEQEAIQARMTEYWDWRGAAYDSAPRHGLQNEQQRASWLAALRQIVPLPARDVLDVGAGTGFLSLLLAEIGHRVTGVDLSEGMLAEARRKAAALPNPPTFLLGDVHAPPRPPATFDVVIERHVLWTLLDPERALQSWSRLLRPGGRLILIDTLWLDRREPDAETRAAEYWQRWEEQYGEAIAHHLPLTKAVTLEPIMALVSDAGFVGAEVGDLAEVERVEQETMQGFSGMSQPRYLLIATKSGASTGTS